jgi:hypothetical protein
LVAVQQFFLQINEKLAVNYQGKKNLLTRTLRETLTKANVGQNHRFSKATEDATVF